MTRVLWLATLWAISWLLWAWWIAQPVSVSAI